MGFPFVLSWCVRGTRDVSVGRRSRRRRYGCVLRRVREYDPSGRGGLERYASRRLWRDSGGYRKGLFPSESRVPNQCPGQTLLSPYLIREVFLRVVTLGGFRLDHDRCVAALIKFGLVRDGANNVAGREPEGCAQGSQCRDEHRDDDFDDLFPCHNGGGF